MPILSFYVSLLVRIDLQPKVNFYFIILTYMLYSRLLYFYESYKALKKLSVRVHWGKAFQMSPAEVKAVYPKFEDFAKIQTLLDPKGIFLNELLRQTFGF